MLNIYQRQINLRFYYYLYTGEIDGIEGNKTKEAYYNFQKRNNLVADKIYGENTNQKLINVIKNIQSKLNEKGYNISVDGIVGDITINTLKDFQSKNNLVVDGIFGNNTCNKLFNSNKFIFPVNYIAITTYYNNNHLGIDLGYNNKYGKNMLIHSVEDGIVTENSYNKTYGNYVVISHPNNYKSRYLHLKNKSDLRVNTNVSKGQIIGNMGNTGLASGNHLHFDLYKNNSRVNPLDYLFVNNNQEVCDVDKNKVKYL